MRCSVPGCSSRGEYLCDFPLKGKKEGQTCDRPMCRRHAKLIKHNTHYCPAHAKAVQEKTVPERFSIDD